MKTQMVERAREEACQHGLVWLRGPGEGCIIFRQVENKGRRRREEMVIY